MIFRELHFCERPEIDSARNFLCRKEIRFYFTSGTSSSSTTSTTNQTETNQQTSVQAQTAQVAGAGNSGIVNGSGIAVKGSNNNVTVTTADPAIVQSALTSNSLIATEALTTYDHLVTGQTAGQLQALQESQNSSDALVGASQALAAQVATPGNVQPVTDDSSRTNLLHYLFIGGGILIVLIYLRKRGAN